MKNLLGEQSIRGKGRIRVCFEITALNTRMKIPLNENKISRSTKNQWSSSHPIYSLFMTNGVGIAQS